MAVMTMESPQNRFDASDDDGIMHLATEEHRARAVRGEPWMTLCGMYRELLRHQETMLTTDPRACVACNWVHEKAVI